MRENDSAESTGTLSYFGFGFLLVFSEGLLRNKIPFKTESYSCDEIMSFKVFFIF